MFPFINANCALFISYESYMELVVNLFGSPGQCTKELWWGMIQEDFDAVQIYYC